MSSESTVAAVSSLPDEKPIRAFIALFPSPDVQDRIIATQRALKKHDRNRAVRWTAPTQIHLTLKFLGNISPTIVPELQLRLTEVCCDAKPMQLEAAGLGAFPNLSRPRVLWMGLEGDLNALTNLQRRIEDALASVAPREERGFNPHLTLGRIKNPRARDLREVASALKHFSHERFGQWCAEEIQLMQSELSTEGAQYRSLSTIPLGPAIQQ